MGKLPKGEKSVRVIGRKVTSISPCSLQSGALPPFLFLTLVSVRPAGSVVFKFLIIEQQHRD